MTDGATKQGSDALGGAKEKTDDASGNVTESLGSVGKKTKESSGGLSDKASGGTDEVNNIGEQGKKISAKATDTLSNLAPTDIVKDPKGVFADDGVGNAASDVTNKSKGATDEVKGSTNGVANKAKGKTDGVEDIAGGAVDKSQEETGEVIDKATGTTDHEQDAGKINKASMNGININTGDLMKAISPSGGGNLDGKGIEINVQTTKEGMSVTIKIPTSQ